MAKLKNFSGADMNTQAKEYNDVYGQVELDYAREFDEGDIERQVAEHNLQQLQGEFNRVTSV
jgi:hypothetical protein